MGFPGGSMMLRLLAGLVALVLPLFGDGAGEGAARRDACRRARARSDLDHADHRQHPRHAGLRHAVRQRRRPCSRSRRWSASTRSAEDKLTYTFTLRDGLKFHDGSPVTTKDVIASLKRWGAQGRRRPAAVLRFVDKLEAVDDKTFRMIAERSPTAWCWSRSARPARSVAVIMREKEARHRPAAADQGGDRLRPLHVRQGPVGAGQQGGLPQERRLRAAPGSEKAVVLRRRQDSRASTASSSCGSPIRRPPCRR